MKKNTTPVADVYCPPCWLGLCGRENSQWCPLSENGHFHGVTCSMYDIGTCPYVLLRDEKVYLVIINEQHSLFFDQERLLQDRKVLFLKVPAQGLTLDEMKEWTEALITTLIHYPLQLVVFASPIPYFLRELSRLFSYRVLLFHNDKREKKELPDGRIIQTVAKEGWQLV